MTTLKSKYKLSTVSSKLSTFNSQFSTVKVRQHDKNDCGAACLASVASWYGLKLPLIVIREACGTTSSGGTSIKGILDAAASIGLEGKALKSTSADLTKLKDLSLPCILHLKRDDGWMHFVVMYQYEDKGITVMNPDKGAMEFYSNEKLAKEWSGYLILLSPSASFRQKDETVPLKRRFMDIIYENKRELFYGFAGSVVYVIAAMSMSIFLQQLIDKIIPSQNLPGVLFITTILLIMMILILYLSFKRYIYTLKATININSSLIIGYIRHLFRLPVSFFKSRGTGEINSRIGDAFKIGGFISITLNSIIISIITLIMAIALFFAYQWKLALFILIFLPMYGIIYLLANKVNKRINRAIIENAAKFEEITVDNLGSIESSIYFGGYDLFTQRTERQYEKMIDSMYKGGRVNARFSVISDAVTRSMTIVLILIGSLLIFKGELSIGELVSFYSIISLFSAPILNIINSNSEITEADISARRICEIIDLPAGDGDEAELIDKVPEYGDISFNSISFSYPGREELFRDLSFRIPLDKINAIVGESGSGKSTVASMLMRAYSPKSGNIEIAGQDINKIETKSWRDYISIVPQRIEMFNGTLIENITMSEDNQNIEEVLDICRRVGLISLIERMNSGIMTKVGENGMLLSGGERHKLAIARALYRDPKVLIFDEATESLDRENFEFIISLIKELHRGGKGIILISHNRDTISIAENIIEITSAHSGQIPHA